MLAAALVLVACGATASTSRTSSPARVGPSGLAASSAPTGSGPTSSGPTPQPTRWPVPAVHGIAGLGGGDAEIAKAVADFSEAVAAEDLKRMRAAAIGLQTLITGLGTSVDQIAGYAPMASLATRYRTAFAPMLDGSRALVTAIDAGDATGIVNATGRITEGMQAYGAVRSELSDWVDELPDQQHMLVE
jgi:hypothetical protein